MKFYMSNKRFIVIAIILILMWLGLMLFFYLKADEVTKNPCQICAKQMNTDVMCSAKIGDKFIIFHPNYTMEDQDYARTNLLQ